MTVKITITVEGDPEEIPAALRKLLSGSEEEQVDKDMMQQTAFSAGSPKWVRTSGSQSLNAGFTGQSTSLTSEELGRLWSKITEGARKALSEIALRPDGYLKEEIYAALHLEGRIVGGSLSSVGAAMVRLGFWNKGTKAGKEWPWSFDGVYYRMKPEIAEIIRQMTH